MLFENQLFGDRDLVGMAIERIRLFEARALKMSPDDGYWVAFSGGKDSMVVLDLVRRAGVKHVAHFSITTVDPPELMQFIKRHYPDVIRDRPKTSMWKLIVKKMMPPTRTVRYCCQELKEGGGNRHMVVTGVRWAESNKRSKRRLTETCMRGSEKAYLNPIIDWTDAEVWEYIRENKMPYCRLYDEGFKRVGCVGCPMAGKNREMEFRRWPGFERSYRQAFAAAAAANRIKLGNKYGVDGKSHVRWVDGGAMFSWWMEDDHHREDPDQGVLFE